MSLTFADLQRSNTQRKDMNHETCRIILETCNSQIKHNNDHKEKCLFFVIPEIVPGRPIMPVRQVGAYLVDRLTKANLQVTPISNNILFIDWSHPPPGAPSHARPTRSHTHRTTNKDESAELRSRLLSFRRRAAGWSLK